MNACLDFLRNLDKKCVHYNNCQKNLKSSNNKLNIGLILVQGHEDLYQYTDHRLGKCVLYLHTKQETDVFIVWAVFIMKTLIWFDTPQI